MIHTSICSKQTVYIVLESSPCLQPTVLHSFTLYPSYIFVINYTVWSMSNNKRITFLNIKHVNTIPNINTFPLILPLINPIYMLLSINTMLPPHILSCFSVTIFSILKYFKKFFDYINYNKKNDPR